MLLQARDRLASVQKALSAAKHRSSEAVATSEATEEVEAAVCRAAQRVAALKEALSGDETALAARLATQASRLKSLQSDARACEAAVRAAELARGAKGVVDEAALADAVVEQQRSLAEAAEVRRPPTHVPRSL